MAANWEQDFPSRLENQISFVRPRADILHYRPLKNYKISEYICMSSTVIGPPPQWAGSLESANSSGGVMLSFLQSVPPCRCEQTKACVAVSRHLELTVSCAAMLRCGAKAHLFPDISVYSSNAKPLFHFTALSVFWSCIRSKALCLNRRQITFRIPLFTFWRA